MSYLDATIKSVGVTFGVIAVATGIQALISPAAFARGFRLPLQPAATSTTTTTTTTTPGTGAHKRKTAATPTLDSNTLTESYVSVMGVRQLAIGITMLVFSYQRKWDEVVTMMTIVGSVVAGTDGLYMARADVMGALTHAIPGVLLSLLSGAYLYSSK